MFLFSATEKVGSKRRIILLLFCLWVIPGLAQKTKVVGSVKDALTFEPVPFANVAFKGTIVGTNTDMDGNFSIETDKPVDSITASFIGYIPVTMKVLKGKTQTISIYLQVNKVDLPEIVVLPGKNPAIELLEKVIENKDKNNAERLDAYQYEVYNKVEFDINDISEKFKSQRLMRPFAFIFNDYIDSNTTNKKTFLPIFLSENISNYYYRKNPKASKEIIEASKISGIDNPTITQFLGDMYQHTNIYENFIIIFKKSFVSPISTSGQAYYKYYLVDSAFFGNKWCYKISYVPRRKQELTFTGDFWVNDSSFAIKKISARIADDANLNFVEDLAVVQEFDEINSQWMLSKDILVIDFSAREQGMSFIGRKSTSYRDFVLNQPKGTDFFLKGDNIIEEDSARQHSQEYWNSARHDTLQERERKIYQMVDTIKSLPAFKTWVDVITLFVTGYKEVGFFEFGPYYTFVSFNSVEGPRLRLGGRTGNKFSTDLILSGYLAYGTKDGKFKYNGGAQYYFSKKPRNSIAYFYKNDMEQLGTSENAFMDDNILSSVTRRAPANKLTRIEENKLFYDYEWYPGFSSRINLIHRFYLPIGELDYSYFRDFPDTTKAILNSLNTSEISIVSRFAYREKFISGKVDRVSLGTKYPILQIKYILGLKGVLKSEFTYHKLSLQLSHYFHVGYFGWTEYVAEAGKIWGTIPYPLLEVHEGNESYSYDYMAFSLMNYYEFISDQYATLFLTHHFDGIFLNRIPLLRKLKWREVVTAKSAIGGLSTSNLDILVNKNTFSVLNSPYLETGAGIENIFKVFRVDAVWRMTYIDKTYLKTYYSHSFSPIARFGIRASLQFNF